MESKNVGNVLNRLLCVLSRLLVGYLTIFFSAPAHAAVTCAYESESGSPVTFYVRLPRVLAVPRDTPIGAILFSESMTVPHRVTWRCSGDFISGVINAAGDTASASQKTDFPIGNTGLAWSLDMNDRRVPDIKWGILNETPVPGGITWNVFEGTSLLVKIKKIGQIKAGAVIPDRVLGYFSAQYQLDPLKISVSNGAVIGSASCKTPDITVKMGDQNSAEQFNGVGTSLAPVNFSIALRECPWGINRVWYQLKPNTEVVDARRSVVALDSESSAKGVGLQLLDNKGNPLQLKSWYQFREYYKGGGNFDIPLKAAYQQTASVVLPGTANTSATLVMYYD